VSEEPDQRSPSALSASRIELAPGVFAPASAVRVQYSRSGGPGGQNVNKVNTRVQLWVPVGGIVGLSEPALARLRQFAGKRLTAADEINIVAETERTQERNRQAVMDRLRLLIEQAAREPKRRRKTKPSRAARERRLAVKKRRGEIKARRQGRE
jgi:ribosome-associated protein